VRRGASSAGRRGHGLTAGSGFGLGGAGFWQPGLLRARVRSGGDMPQAPGTWWANFTPLRWEVLVRPLLLASCAAGLQHAT
jgi:hypothetical protein